MLIWEGSEDALDASIEFQINKDFTLFPNFLGFPSAHDQAHENRLELLVHLRTNLRDEESFNSPLEPLWSPRGVSLAINCLELVPEVFAKDLSQDFLHESICFE